MPKAIIYQHVVPQREIDHEPTPIKRGNLTPVMRCHTCGKRIMRVDENDGPEGLKALFRF